MVSDSKTVVIGKGLIKKKKPEGSLYNFMILPCSISTSPFSELLNHLPFKILFGLDQ